MSRIGEYTIQVPAFGDFDWGEALAEADGVEKDLMLNQIRLVKQLESVPPLKATPERLAWLGFSARAFQILNAARGALSHDSEFGMSAAHRSSFEVALQMQVIMEPVSVLAKASRSAQTHVAATAWEREWLEAVKRLRAYAAWCLLHDSDYWRFVLSRGVLDDIWDGGAERDIVQDPKHLAFHEKMFGPLDLMNEHELVRERQQMEEEARAALERISGWLGEPGLVEWRDKCRAMSDGNNRRVPEFFALFDESAQSIGARLRNQELRFAYGPYMHESMLLHGSSLDALFVRQATAIAPRLVDVGDKLEGLARGVAADCARVLLCLELVRGRVWAVA
jgi:hypothetical protein